tara:strand:+ start:185 stop:496 length:312 start_codon:yes stop_codon:yes gene_type:complete
MAEEYFIHEVIISDSKGNLFNYHSDHMNENFSYDKEYDQISEYRPTQVTEQLRVERDKTVEIVQQLWFCLREGYTYNESQIHMRAFNEGKTTAKKVVVIEKDV